MKGKYILTGAVALLLAGLVTLSPLGLPRAIEMHASRSSERSKHATYEHNLKTVENMVAQAVKAFNDERTFDVYYGDVAKLEQVFAGVAGIEVKEIYDVDPMNDYLENALWQEDKPPAAVKFELLVTDLESALKVIGKMELPVHSFTYNAPSEMTLTILTGGEV